MFKVLTSIGSAVLGGAKKAVVAGAKAVKSGVSSAAKKTSEAVSKASSKASQATDAVNKSITNFRDSKPKTKEESPEKEPEPVVPPVPPVPEPDPETQEGNDLINQVRNNPDNAEDLEKTRREYYQNLYNQSIDGYDEFEEDRLQGEREAEQDEELPEGDPQSDIIKEIRRTNRILSENGAATTASLDRVNNNIGDLGGSMNPEVVPPRPTPPPAPVIPPPARPVPPPAPPKPDPEVKKNTGILAGIKEALTDKVAGGLDMIRSGIVALDEKLGNDTGDTGDEIKARDEERKTRSDERKQKRSDFLEKIKSKAKGAASGFGEFAGLLPLLLFVASFLAKKLVMAFKGVGNFIGKSVDKTKEYVGYNLKKGALNAEKSITFTDKGKADLATREAALENEHTNRGKEIDIDANLASASNDGSKKDRISAANDYLQSKGYKPHQAAGILGNLIAESDLNPKQKQNGGGPGRGIAQWEQGPGEGGARFRGLESYAASKGTSWDDFQTQVEYLSKELDQGGNGKKQLLASKNVKESTQAFLNYFERSKIANNRSRYKKNKKTGVLEYVKGDDVSYNKEVSRRLKDSQPIFDADKAQSDAVEAKVVEDKAAGVSFLGSLPGQTPIVPGQMSMTSDPMATIAGASVVPVKKVEKPTKVKEAKPASKEGHKIVAGNNSNNSNSQTTIINNIADNSLNVLGS